MGRTKIESTRIFMGHRKLINAYGHMGKISMSKMICFQKPNFMFADLTFF